jgi:Beta-propeller repeat
LVYSTYLGGSDNSNGSGDTGSGIAVDRHGNAYVTGQTTSIDFPTKNAFQKKLNSPNGNAFVTKFDAAGTALVYSTYLGGSSTQVGDFGLSVAVNSAGEAYVTGDTWSSDFPTKDAFQPVYGGSGDGFVTKIDAAGCALVYSSFLGGSSLDGPGDAADLAPCSNCIAVGQAR